MSTIVWRETSLKKKRSRRTYITDVFVRQQLREPAKNNSIFSPFHTFLALFGPFYGLFGKFIILFNTKTPFLALLGGVFPEKMSRLSIRPVTVA